MKCSALMETQLKQSMQGICATFHHSDPMRSIAYTTEDIKWCEATIDFLEGQLSHEAPAVLHTPCETCPPQPRRRRCAKSRACVRAAAAKAAAAAPQNDHKEGSR